MGGCPYCGEAINLEARICKHCQRPTLYSVILNESLDDKQKHNFFRDWKSVSKNGLKHFSLASYSSAKVELDKIPLILAWDLNQNEAEHLIQSLKEFPLSKTLQGGMPSTYQPTEAASPSTLSGALYGCLGVLVLGLGLYLAWSNKQSKAALDFVGENPPVLSEEYKSFVAQRNLAEAHSGALIPNSKDNLEKSEVEIALSSTVFIRDANRLGSGFLVTSDGYIISNAHVTSEMQAPVVILHDGRQYEAKKISEDSTLDIALIKIQESGLSFLKLGDANQLYPGQPIVAVGNPGGLSFTVTRGIVSYVGRNLNGVPYIQTDAAINRGNSGGPMINSNLEVVGINTLTSSQEQGISFSIPINFICASGGIASHIATTPSTCPSFMGSHDAVMSATIDHGEESKPSPKSDSPLVSYNNEADRLRQALDRDENDLKSEETRLKAEGEAAKASLEADPLNGSLQDRVNQKIADVQKRLLNLNRRRAQSQLTYIRNLRSLMEQQRNDPAFNRLVATIDSQIQGLKAKEQELQGFIDKTN